MHCVQQRDDVCSLYSAREEAHRIPPSGSEHDRDYEGWRRSGGSPDTLLEFASAEELAAVVAGWPMSRLVAIWNTLAGSDPGEPFY
jgi:hypothetical protein